jgi:hypothetical protein
MRLDAQDPLSEVLSIAAAAAEVGRAPATLRGWIRENRLVPLRVGGRTFTTARAVREAERSASGFGEAP